MLPFYVYVPIVVVALLAGFGAAYLLFRRRQGDGTSALEIKAQQALSEAETQAKEKLLEAKEEAVGIRTAAEQEAREYRAQSQQVEKRLLQRRRTSIGKLRTSAGASVSSGAGRRRWTRSELSSKSPTASRRRSFSASRT